MKKIFSLSFLLWVIAIHAFAQANKSLSNLSSPTSGFAELKIPNGRPSFAEGLQNERIRNQNIPNLFSGPTLIPFRIPNDCHDASIKIINNSRNEVISVLSVPSNQDHMPIDAGPFSSGNYSYSLYVNGKLIDTK